MVAQDTNLTVSGTLGRAMAIGGESTGWSVHLDTPTMVEGKQLDSIEIAFSDTAKLNELNNQHVRATGKLSHRQGVETGTRSVLEVSSIQKDEAHATAPSLTGTEWVLEDLGGSGVIDDAQATLAFLSDGKVAGRGSCNRFTGTAEIGASDIKIGPLASTRMLCPGAVMNQETKYLKALQSAQRFERDGSTLLVYSSGIEKPLKFTEKVDK
jgi:heat shock protein HslJ